MGAIWKYPFSQSRNAHVDLSSLDAFNEGAPFKTFERMQCEGGVSWTEETNGRVFWSITGHDHILKLNCQPGLLCSGKGIRIEHQSEDEYEARKTFQETDGNEHRYFRMLGQIIGVPDEGLGWLVEKRDALISNSDPNDLIWTRGPHVCLGIWLVKLEVRVVLEEFVRRIATIEQTDNHKYLRSNFILGIKNLPVRMTGA